MADSKKKANATADKAKQSFSNSKTSPTASCDNKIDCAKAWKEVEDEADNILNKSSDYIERNKYINAAYADLYRSNPNLHWAGVAAFASKQVGCGLKDAEGYTGLPFFGDKAKAAYEALGTGNKNVFKDIYPAHRFYQKHGFAALRHCQKVRTPPLDPSVLDGFSDIDTGHPDSGALKILLHEQQDILQTKEIFDNAAFKDALWWAKWNPLEPGLATSFSADCSGPPTVKFDGSDLSDYDQRWPYAKNVVKKFEDLLANPSDKKTLEGQMQLILDRGKE